MHDEDEDHPGVGTARLQLTAQERMMVSSRELHDEQQARDEGVLGAAPCEGQK